MRRQRRPSRLPRFNPFFAEDNRFVYFCRGGADGCPSCVHACRALIATLTAQRMGLAKVRQLGGGLSAWIKAGGAVEPGAQRA